MAGRLSRHRTVGALAASLMLATAVTLTVANGQVLAQADDWQPCPEAAENGRIERIEIVLAVDRSGSLEIVDPNGTGRRGALYGTREKLANLQESISGLLGGSGSEADLELEVALVAFDTEVEEVAVFAPVALDHPPDTAIEGALGSGGDTDYGPAVEQALSLFEGSANASPRGTCRIFVMFTDGILDPYDTEAGRRPNLEDQAEAHVSNLLDDLCAADPGMRRYRQRLSRLGVSSYVAVLRNPSFERGAGSSHLDVLARASKQMFLAMTGHGASPLLTGVSAAPGCESWSAERSGKVIEMDDIGDLARELTNVVGEIGLAVRRPRISCTPGESRGRLFGDWPQGYRISDPAGERLCKVTPPLDGEMVLSAGGPELPGGAVWLIDTGEDPTADRRLSPGDEELPFNIVSSLLPEHEPVGAVDDAEIEIAATWYPDPELRAAWPEQPAEVRVAGPLLLIDLPDREEYWLVRHVEDTCRGHQRAVWVGVAGGTRAEASELCAPKAPPGGEFEMTLVPIAGNRLAWSTALAGGGGLEPVAPGESIRINHGDPEVLVGATSQILAPADRPYEGFTDQLGFRLIWRSSLGHTLADRAVPDADSIEIEVPPPPPPSLLECDDTGAQVTAARRIADSAGWELVVDTGCRLLRQPPGTAGVTVVGNVGGAEWRLVDPPPGDGGEESWPTREEVTVGPSATVRRLFAGVGHPELAGHLGDTVEFTLVPTLSIGGSVPVEGNQARRTVTVYLPMPDCADDEDAVRFTPPSSDGDEGPNPQPDRARVEGLCEIDPPPNGTLEVRLAASAQDQAPESPLLDWCPKSGGENNLKADPRCFLSAEPDSEPLVVGAVSDSLPTDRVGAVESVVRVGLLWRSELGYESESDKPVRVIVPPDALDLLDCSGSSAVRGGGSEVPEVPLVVDTGCVLKGHDAGRVSVADVVGYVADLRWRVPEVSIEPGDPDRPIQIESDGVLPNEALNRRVTFELVATLTPDGDAAEQVLPDHQQDEVLVQYRPRVRISCAGAPQIVDSPIEVPEGPLVVDTGCTLHAPVEVGEVTAELVPPVGDGLPDVAWRLVGETRLGPRDGTVSIRIRTTEPLPNRRYETTAEFSLAATWHPPDGAKQDVGGHHRPDRSDWPKPEFTMDLRARPSTGTAVLIAVVLLLGGLFAGWVLLAGLGRRANRLPRSGEYRLVGGEVTATLTPGSGVELDDFDLSRILGGKAEPLLRRRGRLRAGGLTIRVRRKWLSPRDLLRGGRAAVVPHELKNALVAVAPSVGSPDSLSPSLAPGAVIVALDPASTVSRQDADRHRARLWILIPSAAKQAPEAKRKAESNLRKALGEMGRRRSPKSAHSARTRTARDPARDADHRPPPPRPDSRPKG